MAKTWTGIVALGLALAGCGGEGFDNGSVPEPRTDRVGERADPAERLEPTEQAVQPAPRPGQ